MIAAATLHLFVILLTPFYSADVVQREVAATNAFYEKASAGRLHVVADVSPLVENFVVPKECFERPPGVDRGLGAFATAARRAANAPAGYDRYVYVTGTRVCGAGGLGVGDDILLGENLALVHELGHTLGLPHAATTRCAVCDPFTPMGRGGVDLSSWEKVKLGWLARRDALVVAGYWIDRAPPNWVVIRTVRNGGTVLVAAGRRTATVPGVLRARLVSGRIVVTRLRR